MATSNAILSCMGLLYHTAVYILTTTGTLLYHLTMAIFSLLSYLTLFSLFVVENMVYIVLNAAQLLFSGVSSTCSFLANCVQSLWSGVDTTSDSINLPTRQVTEGNFISVVDLVLLIAWIAIIVVIVLVSICVLIPLTKLAYWKVRRAFSTNNQRHRRAVDFNPLIRNTRIQQDETDTRQRRLQARRPFDSPAFQRKPTIHQRRQEMDSWDVGMNSQLPNWQSLEGFNDESFLGDSLMGDEYSLSFEQTIEKPPTSNTFMKSEDISDLHMKNKVQELEMKLLRETESKQCVVCMDQPRMMMFRPCNHYCVCESCSKQLNKCPICTRHITRKEKVYNV